MNKLISQENAKEIEIDNLTKETWEFQPRKKEKKQIKVEYQMLVRRQSFGRYFNIDFKERQNRVKILFGIIQKTCQILEFQVSTFCMTIQIFDSMISKLNMKKRNMIKYAFVSLQLAAKINEPQIKIISYEDFNRYIFPIPIQEFIQIERIICRALDFRLHPVTGHSFICLLMEEFLKPEYNFFGAKDNNSEKTVKFWEVVLDLHFLTLANYDFYHFSSLGVALSVIILARNLFGLDPWTPEMENFTGCSKADLRQSITFLFKLYKSNSVMDYFKSIDQAEQNSNNMLLECEKSSTAPSLVGSTREYILSERIIKNYVCSSEQSCSKDYK